MVKKILMLGVMAVMALGFFAGCGSGIKFSVAFEGKGYANGAFSFTDTSGEELGVHNLVKLINSFEELKSFCDEVNNPAFLQESPKYSNDLSKKIREYDEAFFAEKSLIVYLLTAPNAGTSYKIKNLKVDGEELLLDIRIKESKHDSAAVITPWTFLIEVNKADIAGITSIGGKTL